MRFIDFRRQVLAELMKHPAGLTWAQLRDCLELPYRQPCPTWVRRLEREDGLTGTAGAGHALIWQVGSIC